MELDIQMAYFVGRLVADCELGDVGVYMSKQEEMLVVDLVARDLGMGMVPFLEEASDESGNLLYSLLA